MEPGGAVETQGSTRRRLAVAAVALYSVALLSIGIRKDWRLLHEDNGAFHTTLALSHVKLGLARTRAHDLFFEPATGRSFPYGHHPPGLPLLVAAAFAVTGSDAPWVARSVAILFQTGSLLLFIAILRRFFPFRTALFGGLVFATLPMSSFFGRMVNYEALCLFAVLLQLMGLVSLEQSGFRRGRGVLCLGIVLGALFDWPAFFFAGAIAAALVWDAVRGSAGAARAAAVAVVVAAAALGLVLGHLAWADHGSLDRLRQVIVPGPSGTRPRDLDFFLGRLEAFRRYYTIAGLDASLLAAAAILLPGSALAVRLFNVPEGGTLRRFLCVNGAAAGAYVLAAPLWARRHAYWQFYFLPLVVVSMLLGFRLLWGVAGRWRVVLRVLAAVFALEFLAASGYTLYIRHTRVGEYAVDETARLRGQFLAPVSLRAGD
jgi:4-amino-4-deoxy-L-arabinose transferase-like glycosyltransferase